MRIGESIYLDYQSTTPLEPEVREAMTPYFADSFGNPHSNEHVLGWQASTVVEQARSSVASLIGALSNEVVFTSGATEANNQAIAGCLFANKTDRRTVLISAIEHKCVKEAARFYGEKLGYTVIEIPVLNDGRIDEIAYHELLCEDVVLVSVMAVNNEIGVIQEVKRLAEAAHEYGALFHTDAAQAPEAVDLDVLELGVDLLSLSAHKIYGPKGIGALFIDSSLHGCFPALIQGGGQQSGLRSGTLPTALCVGFGVAAESANDGAIDRRLKLESLRARFLSELREGRIEFTVNGSLENRHPGNLNLQFPGVDASALLAASQPVVCASTGSACNSGFIAGSYVLRALGMTEEQINSSVRFGLGRFSDETQVIKVVEILVRKIRQLTTSEVAEAS